ncbi:hypothetical protein [uncultured Duncaniella sp.]|uniref:hypothetical protein n=1 Tax=uncultured Duncaniella sp. TaxID=2768039 RepID=UPI0026018C6C|nr:hypothetical protein [uncultured Duncaniella sp.]
MARNALRISAKKRGNFGFLNIVQGCNMSNHSNAVTKRDTLIQTVCVINNPTPTSARGITHSDSRNPTVATTASNKRSFAILKLDLLHANIANPV